MWVKNPDVWAVIVATSALIISGITWWSVHRQLLLTAGQVKSYVQVVEARLSQPVSSASFIELQMKIKNFGQTAAVQVYGDMDYRVEMPDPKGQGNDATRRKFGSMGPGMERTIILKSNRMNRENWSTTNSRLYKTAYFYGTIWFTDDTTHEQRKEDWCYALPLKTKDDLERTDLVSCGVLTYNSKEKQQ